MFYFSNLITRGFTQFVTLALWWYGGGFWLAIKRFAWLEKRDVSRIGVHVWIRNFFVPMFHDYTLVGRALSVVFRFFIIIGKTVNLLVRTCVRLIVLLVWIALPLLFVAGLVVYGFKFF